MEGVVGHQDMKMLITGNLGYVGACMMLYLRSRYPQVFIAGYDTGYFQHFDGRERRARKDDRCAILCRRPTVAAPDNRSYELDFSLLDSLSCGRLDSKKGNFAPRGSCA